VQRHYERNHGHGERQAGDGHGEFDADAVLVDPGGSFNPISDLF
jgi:hypothetical protein